MNPYTDREKLYAKQQELRERNKEFVLDYLRAHPCVECGEADPAVLDFDHLDHSEKNFSIARMVGGQCASLERLQVEMDKCQVLCANCHRRKTFRERGIDWKRL